MKEKTLNQKRAKAIGDMIKNIRHYHKLRQQDAAEILPFSRDQICKIECGKRRMTVTELFAFCEVLRMSPSELVERIEVELFMKELYPPPQKLRKIATVKPSVIQVDVSWDGRGFTGSFDESVPMSQLITAYTFQKLKVVVEAFIESLEERLLNAGESVPTWILHKRYEFKYHFLDVAALLKAYMPLLSLAVISRETGINQHRLSLYANGKAKAQPYQLQRIVSGIHRIAKELMLVAP